MAKNLSNDTCGISLVLNGHQPLGYNRYESINKGIYERCYLSNLELKNYVNQTGSGPLGISLNISGAVLLDILEHQNDSTARRLLTGLKEVNEKAISTFGVSNFVLQASLFHSIIPLLPKESKSLQYQWSDILFRYIFGSQASGVWLPEQAYNQDTLEMLAQEHADWTLLPSWNAQSAIDLSEFYSVQTPKGELAVAFYDQGLSNSIFFGRCNWNFSSSIKGRNQHDHMSWVLTGDLERFGEHGSDEKDKKDAPWLLNNLVYFQIPNEGYRPWPFQALFTEYKKAHAPSKVNLSPTGSWSCLCKGSKEGVEKELARRGLLKDYQPYLERLPQNLDYLMRWCVPCGCTNHGNFHYNKWKIPFKSGMTNALVGLHSLYSQASEKIVSDPGAAAIDFMNIKVRALSGKLSKRDLDGFIQRNLKHTDKGSLLQLFAMLEGIFHIEAAQTSCGTYWENPFRIEPGYNIKHAANSLKLFQQAGEDVKKVQDELGAALEMSYPGNGSQFKEALDSKAKSEHSSLDKIMEQI